jgi:hypothetical protein
MIDLQSLPVGKKAHVRLMLLGDLLSLAASTKPSPMRSGRSQLPPPLWRRP